MKSLLAYAVSRKLTHDSTLLKYITNDQSIPVDIIEQEFSPLLTSFEDENGSELVENYQSYLSKNYPVGFLTKENALYADGEIDNRVLEAIHLVHEKDIPSIVKDHIQQAVKTINPDKTVSDIQLTLFEKAKQFAHNAQRYEEFVKDDKALVLPPATEVSVHEDTVEGVIEQVEMIVENETSDSVEDSVDKSTELTEDIKDIEEDMEDSVEESVELTEDIEDIEDIEEDIEDITESIELTEVDEDTIDDIEDVAEDTVEDIVEDETGEVSDSKEPLEEVAKDVEVSKLEDDQHVQQLLVEIWNDLVKNIKEHNLTERINIQSDLPFLSL